MQRLFCKKKLMLALGLMLGVVLVSAAPALAVPLPPPSGAPSWWGAEDGYTVSLSWYFDDAADPPVANFDEVPAPWFNGTPYAGEKWDIKKGSRFSLSPKWHDTVAGRNGVWGYDGESGTNQGQWNVLVDNEADPSRLTHVWYQIDYYLSEGASIANGVSVDAGYGISNWMDNDVALENGWRRLTVSLDIEPQPENELFWHDIFAPARETAVIDQLHVATRCVPEPASLLLLGVGLLGLAGGIRKRKNQGVSCGV